jgi:thioredoxin 1
MSEFLAVNQDNFQQEVLQSSVPVLVEFGAVWCAPCKRLEPILLQLGNEWQGKVRIAKLDVDESADLTMQFQIMSVPTLVLFQHGKVQQRITGLQPRERLVEKFAPFLAL